MAWIRLKKVVCVMVGMLAGCGSDKATAPDPTAGTAQMALTISAGVKVDRVDYTIAGGTPALAAPIVGAVDVSDPGASLTFFIRGVPSGVDYKIVLLAKSSDGKTTCSGSAGFDIAKDQTSVVLVALQCRADTMLGSVAVSGDTNNCPVITSLRVGPLTTNLAKIPVSSTATDLDPEDVVALSWSAGAGGTFDPPNTGVSNFSCRSAGIVTLSLSASDGKCTTSMQVDVTCVTFTCGNGRLDAGEECDPPGSSTNGGLCTSTCSLPSICGNNKVELGEVCDPPGLGQFGFCLDCKRVISECGDSIVAVGEQCDPPGSPVPGGLCTVDCRLPRVPGTCGDGLTDIGEACDDGPSGSPTCTKTCDKILTACEMCEATACNAETTGCQLYQGQRRKLCEAWLNCILGPKGNNCSSRGRDPVPCFCGSATQDECLAGAGAGECRAEGFAAAESMPCAPTETAAECNTRQILNVAERFRDPAYPIGGGTNAVFCYGESCLDRCFRGL